MTDKNFKKLKEAIELKALELELLQELYIREAGFRYIPGNTLKNQRDKKLCNQKKQL